MFSFNFQLHQTIRTVAILDTCAVALSEDHLRPWPLLLLFVQGEQGNTGDLHDLESDSGNITDGVTLTTESSDQNFIVLLNEVETTIPGDERSDLLSVLDQLDPYALTDGGVRLFGFNSNFFQDDSLGVGGSTKRIGLPAGSQVRLLVVLVMPSLLTTVVLQLASSPKTSWLTHSL